MHARTEALVGLGALVLVSVLVTTLGRRRAGEADVDPRPSSLLTGPHGARGFADALVRLGHRVTRFRGATAALPIAGSDSARTLLVLLDPTDEISSHEVAAFRSWNDSVRGGDLLLAGARAIGLMECFGYTVDSRPFDSVTVRAPAGQATVAGWPKVTAVLAASNDSVIVDSSRAADYRTTRCAVPPIGRIDTLLMSTTGRAVGLRLERSDVDRRVLLFADAGLFRNRALRETDAGPFALRLVGEHYDRVIFEETHHGFSEGGSLAGAVIAWSIRSPWGWAMWQVALVGLLALLAGAVRFGRPRLVLERRRRSPLEHVRALATALAAARGHDVAIAAIVTGLRRRLSPAGQRSRGDWRQWLIQLGAQGQSARARDAVNTLQSLTRPEQTPAGVLRAANAVEDVWEELRP